MNSERDSLILRYDTTVITYSANTFGKSTNSVILLSAMGRL